MRAALEVLLAAVRRYLAARDRGTRCQEHEALEALREEVRAAEAALR